MKRLPAVCLLLALVAVVHACRSGSADVPRSGARPVSIGLLLDSLKEERWQRDRDFFAARAAELGASVTVQTADGDAAMQLKQADELLRAGVDALVVVPHDGDTAGAIVSAAEKRDVPVVAYDRLIRGSAPALYVSYDNERVGELQAAYLLARAPRGNYVLIGGSPIDNNARQVREGQMRVLQPAIDRGDIRIVLDGWTRDWLPAEAYRYTQQAAQATAGRLAAVVAPNDATAGGAIQALQEAGLAGQVLVSGQDADLPALQRIVAGTQAMTVYKPIAPLAHVAAEAAVALARGEPAVAAGQAGAATGGPPAILLRPVSVDSSSIPATVIRDRFQRTEDVYRYVPKERWPDPPPPTSAASRQRASR